jgi:hypothetical protein
MVESSLVHMQNMSAHALKIVLDYDFGVTHTQKEIDKPEIH